MTDARELPLWFNHAQLGYIDIKRCLTSRSPFLFDLGHAPIKVGDFCRQTGLKRGTWRQAIRVEKDGDIVPAGPLITPPNPLHSPVRRRPAAPPAPVTVRPAAPVAALASYAGTAFSIARPLSQAAREAALEAAAAYLADVDALEAARLEAARLEAPTDASSREMELLALEDLAENASDTRDEEKSCVICHEDLMAGQRLAATGCGHVFCAGCISRSLRYKDDCPTCRYHQPTVTAIYI